jgi:hypothetical protein
VGEEKRIEFCERCGRAVESGRLWKLGIDVPPDGRVERRICVVCAADVRRYLLRHPSSEPAVADEHEPSSRTTRVGWFLVRGIVYAGIAGGVFVLVTWLTSL